MQEKIQAANNLKEIVIFSDVHEYGPHEMVVDWEFNNNCFYLGDNVDLRCCSYNNLGKARERLDFLKEKFGKHFVYGNHELASPVGPDNFVKIGNILLTHGDILFWKFKKVIDYRNNIPGMNLLNRLLTKFIFGYINSFFSLPITKRFKDKAVELANKTQCNIVICGHRHPKKIVNIMYKDVNIIVVPRGKTKLYLKTKED